MTRRKIQKTIQKRVYHSKSRQAQADKTKIRILKSAKKLFESKGFEKTKIDEIAELADVSTPSIYALYKSKLGILRQLIDEALPTEQREALVQKTKIEKSPIKRVQLAAKIARQIYDAEKSQLSFLQGALVLDPVFKKLEQEREQRRYLRLEETILGFKKDGLLKKTLSKEKAWDILWSLTGRDMYRMLVIERKWTSDDYEIWLTNTLAENLFD